MALPLRGLRQSNVVTDTQIGGLEYDYLKGAVGTAILGAGGLRQELKTNGSKYSNARIAV